MLVLPSCCHRGYSDPPSLPRPLRKHEEQWGAGIFMAETLLTDPGVRMTGWESLL